MNLFFHGSKMREELGFSIFSEIVFSDYCKEMWHPEDIIRINTNTMLFCYRANDFGNDNWTEYSEIEFFPWDSIIEIDVNNNRGKHIRTISRESIREWLLTLEDRPLAFPFTFFEKGLFVIMIKGKPFSERSGAARYLKRHMAEFRHEVEKVQPAPSKGPIEISIDVFTTEHIKGVKNGKQVLPDIDRLIHPITDAFENVIYENDRQIRSIRPRIWDVSNAFKELEIGTTPDTPLRFSNVALGCLYPLSKGELNYYTIRIHTHLH